MFRASRCSTQVQERVSQAAQSGVRSTKKHDKNLRGSLIRHLIADICICAHHAYPPPPPCACALVGGRDDRAGLEGRGFLHHVRRRGLPCGACNRRVRALLFRDAGRFPGMLRGRGWHTGNDVLPINVAVVSRAIPTPSSAR